jgi:hypothetical protein
MTAPVTAREVRAVPGKCLGILLCLFALACACSGLGHESSGRELAYVSRPTMAPEPSPPILARAPTAGDGAWLLGALGPGVEHRLGRRLA